MTYMVSPPHQAHYWPPRSKYKAPERGAGSVMLRLLLVYNRSFQPPAVSARSHTHPLLARRCAAQCRFHTHLTPTLELASFRAQHKCPCPPPHHAHHITPMLWNRNFVFDAVYVRPHQESLWPTCSSCICENSNLPIAFTPGCLVHSVSSRDVETISC